MKVSTGTQYKIKTTSKSTSNWKEAEGLNWNKGILITLSGQKSTCEKQFNFWVLRKI